VRFDRETVGKETIECRRGQGKRGGRELEWHYPPDQEKKKSFRKKGREIFKKSVGEPRPHARAIRGVKGQDRLAEQGGNWGNG